MIWRIISPLLISLMFHFRTEPSKSDSTSMRRRLMCADKQVLGRRETSHGQVGCILGDEKSRNRMEDFNVSGETVRVSDWWSLFRFSHLLLGDYVMTTLV